jgi:lipopolysaccharide transport system ATP-binding protein
MGETRGAIQKRGAGTEMSKVVIRMEGLGKRYRRGVRATSGLLRDALAKGFSSPGTFFRRSRAENFWALRNVSAEIGEGEVMGLIGRNGSGKTTLLKILSRITRPTEGVAEIYGRVGTLLEVGTGFHPELTGRENVYFSAAILGMKREETTRKFDEIVAFSELEKFIDTPVKHYSSGMYVRLAFAVAAHLEPEILFVDEVLAVGDINFQRRCLGKMSDVARTGRTIILVSHQLNQIRRLCRRAIWLDGGQVRQVGPTVEIVGAYEAEMAAGAENGSRPAHGRAQFLRWKLEGASGPSDHALATAGEVKVTFVLRANQDIHGVHLGLTLYDQSRHPLWSRILEGFTVVAGVYEISYILSSLPLQPGAYIWRIGMYDSDERLDDWECMPHMQVMTVPLAQTRDDIAGFLNIPSDFHVKLME